MASDNPISSVTPRMVRRLAAILSADVVGYSRLMSEDEEATIQTLTTYRGFMFTLIQQHRGRVVDSPGDNLLAEFASVMDAVQSAVAIQRELNARNAALPGQRRMQFRLGINLGDVIPDGERIYGDGVNIAARLESLAEPGGICISGTVYDQIATKLVLGYEFVGECMVKNITTPVRVYRIQTEARLPGLQGRRWHRRGTKPWLRVAFGLVGLLLLCGGGVASWQLFLLPALPTAVAPAQQTAALALPHRPSIAVLPLVNLSSDPAQEYFSDGMTEDLITELSRISGLFVIAYNSTRTYKGKAVQTAQLSRELGVRYVLDGSVRRADERVRITVRLVDTRTGYHLWAERYDGALLEIFTLQDAITRKIVTSLAVKLQKGEDRPMGSRYTSDTQAWDYYVRARELFRQATKTANQQTRDLLEQAIALDSKFARAYATLAATHRRDWLWVWSADPEASEKFALDNAQRAIDLDASLPHGYKQLALIYVYQRQHEQAIAQAQQAVALDTNDADSYAVLAEVLNYAGQSEQAIKHIQTAMQLDPYHSAHYPYVLGQAYYLQREYQKAEDVLTRSVSRNPKFLPARAYRAAVYMDSGQEALARMEMEVIRQAIPTSAGQRKSSAPFRDPTITEHLRDLWRRAEGGT